MTQKQLALNVAAKSAHLKPGQLLANQAVIIKHSGLFTRTDEATESVVLAVQEGQCMPFVTWKRMIGIQHMADGTWGTLDYCWSGDYFSTLEDAIKSFEKRTAQLRSV